MRRAKRMAIVLTAITIVTTLVASPMSASAQTLDCPEGTTPVLSGPGEVCVKGPDIQLSCPEGYELVPAIPPTNPQILFYCELVPPDSGGGDEGCGADGSSGGSDSGGDDGGSSGSGGGGSGGGGGATPITQESVQKSEAGELNQDFDIS
jgi:hypothetical protein